jgi:hypothetical protein
MRTHSTRGDRVDQGHRVLELNAAGRLVATQRRADCTGRGSPPQARQRARSEDVASVRANLGALTQESARAEAGERLYRSLQRLVIDQQFGHLLSGVVGQRADMGEAYAGSPGRGNYFSDLRLLRYKSARRRSKPS